MLQIILVFHFFRSEDVTKSMYESMYQDKTRIPAPKDKIDVVCDLLLEVMSKDMKKYILPIVSCHVKNSKSKVDNALLEIKSLKGTYLDIFTKFLSKSPVFHINHFLQIKEKTYEQMRLLTTSCSW